MKTIRALTLLLLMLSAMGTAAGQTVVTVVPHSGAAEQVTLEDGGEIVFSSDHMLVYDGQNASPRSYAMADVRSVRFSGPVRITQADACPTLSLSPNPAADRLTVSGCGPGDQPLRIYSLDGATALAATCRDGEAVDISALPHGLYLVRAGQGTAKLIKN
ncbi:MAG: T9SS type A sorting domain-containing protein [Bacteroidales bacterium]|nr:T9SS type A sorting domain-containing protein [Bacteroidales bacterium]